MHGSAEKTLNCYRGAERRYNRVKRWFRDVDIFSKEYLIVPINQTAHWYVIIIQHPSYVPTEKDIMSDEDDDETLGMTYHSFSPVCLESCVDVL